MCKRTPRAAACRAVMSIALASIAGCGDAPAAAPAAAPEPAPAPAPAPTPKPAEPEGPNPCAHPSPAKIELSAGVIAKTPWDLEVTYTIGEKNKAGQPTYDFLLRSGQRRWPTSRSWGNWNKADTWRGFCWRGADRPEEHAPRVSIEIAPVCENGKLVEMGGCRNALP